MVHRNGYCNSKNNQMKKLVTGLLVIAAGFVLLLLKTDIIDQSWWRVFFSWQMLLIAIGLINVASRESRFIGWVLMAVGGFFILPKIPVLGITYDFTGMFWPLLLILVGLLILFTGHFKAKFKIRDGKSIVEEGFIDEVNIFGGSKQRLTDEVFKGGKITNIFGGTELDLTQVELNEGKNVLDITCIFGGVSLIVPPTWKVKSQVTSILGGFADKRTIIRETDKTGNELVITGATIFGGGEVKSY